MKISVNNHVKDEMHRLKHEAQFSPPLKFICNTPNGMIQIFFLMPSPSIGTYWNSIYKHVIVTFSGKQGLLRGIAILYI